MNCTDLPCELKWTSGPARTDLDFQFDCLEFVRTITSRPLPDSQVPGTGETMEPEAAIFESRGRLGLLPENLSLQQNATNCNNKKNSLAAPD
jgi:hypothetical protein